MLRSLRHFLYERGRKLGYTILPNWRSARYPQTAYLQRLFTLLDIDCVLDVGANTGQYRDYLRAEVGFEGTVISFEPIPDNVTAMRSRARGDARWLIQECALGAKSGHADFHVMARTTFSSFLRPSDTQLEEFRDANAVRRHITVDVCTLDDVLPALLEKLNVKRPYLKMDTQGYDLEVINGARATLPLIRALQTEASIRPLYDGMPDFATVMGELQSAGFEPSGIFPNDDGHFPLLVEFDLHMISRRWCTAATTGADRTGETTSVPNVPHA